MLLYLFRCTKSYNLLSIVIACFYFLAEFSSFKKIRKISRLTLAASSLPSSLQAFMAFYLEDPPYFQD